MANYKVLLTPETDIKSIATISKASNQVCSHSVHGKVLECYSRCPEADHRLLAET
jgi:hypothetical protein